MPDFALSSKIAFISYATLDQEAARSIKNTLEQCGVSCWMAPDDIAPSKDYAEEIIRGIQTSNVVILLLSEHANKSTFVKKEIERAVSKNKPVFPIRLFDVQPSPALEFFISSSQWIDAWPTPLGPKIELLAKSIQRRCTEQALHASNQTQPPVHARRPEKPIKPFFYRTYFWMASLAGVFGIITGYIYLTPTLNPVGGVGIIPVIEPTTSKVTLLPKESIPKIKKADITSVVTVPISSPPSTAIKKLTNTKIPEKNTAIELKLKYSSSQSEICSNILQRATLGETVSFEEKKLLKTQCP